MARINLRGVFQESSLKQFLALFLIFMSGIMMAISFWIMNTVKVAFEKVHCLIPDNLYFETCQEWFMLSIYPFLDLSRILIWFSYFYIFGVVFGLFYLGWRARKHPSLLAVHLIFSVVVTYLSIEIANVYRTLLENEFMYEILAPFVIYNKIMLNFPTFMFIVVFASGLLGFFGFWKDKELEGDDNLAYA